jgi:hypothetical protein
MRGLLAILVLLPCAAYAAPEAYPVALIDRPLILPQGKAEFGLLGNISNWAVFNNSLTGEAGVLDAEIGLGKAQLGLALALPLNPGFGFGSVFGSAAFAIAPQGAIRLDFGVDHVGLNGDNTGNTSGANIITVGLGAPFRVRLAQNVSFVSGSVGAMNVAHFTNVGSNGTAAYLGAGGLMFNGADIIALNIATEGDARQLAINLPLGILIQAAPQFSITLHAGYEGLFNLGSGGGTEHFLPIGIDAVFSTPGGADIGASFSLAGALGTTDSIAGTVPGYADIRMATLWLRFRT